ncbi:hypothetical protein ANCCAN_17758 [Ancylostoma caninum]|uniref:Uncharacterized protein n=1 Tax=Ancylostoma caninum TaxID=29170 RepID=A0A368FVZ2_ANCCA|nr:hypothetical protein ANCCAN_17758 [Ancylostoma caninum]
MQAPPVLPIESPSRRIEARMRQRMINERLRAVHVPIAGDDGKASIQELMDRYLNKSRESVARTSPPPSPTKKEADPDEIRKLLDRSTLSLPFFARHRLLSPRMPERFLNSLGDFLYSLVFSSKVPCLL